MYLFSLKMSERVLLNTYASMCTYAYIIVHACVHGYIYMQEDQRSEVVEGYICFKIVRLVMFMPLAI